MKIIEEITYWIKSPIYRFKLWRYDNFETKWFKKNSIIIFKLDEHTRPYADQYPFVDGECVVYLGEISNMRGHVIVAKRDGTVRWGYHPENFVVADEDEI